MPSRVVQEKADGASIITTETAPGCVRACVYVRVCVCVCVELVIVQILSHVSNIYFRSFVFSVVIVTTTAPKVVCEYKLFCLFYDLNNFVGLSAWRVSCSSICVSNAGYTSLAVFDRLECELSTGLM